MRRSVDARGRCLQIIIKTHEVSNCWVLWQHFSSSLEHTHIIHFLYLYIHSGRESRNCTRSYIRMRIPRSKSLNFPWSVQNSFQSLINVINKRCRQSISLNIIFSSSCTKVDIAQTETKQKRPEGPRKSKSVDISKES